MRFPQQCGILTSVDSDEPVQSLFKLRHSKYCSVSSLRYRIFKRLAKALIRLRVCAGWSEVLLVALTTLLEISCRGSNLISKMNAEQQALNYNQLSPLLCANLNLVSL